MYVKANQEEIKDTISHGQIPLSIFNHLQQPALVLDCEGRVIVWNEGMVQYTGISAEEMIGRGSYAHGKALFGERRPTLADCILSHDEPRSDHYLLLPHEGEGTHAKSQITLASGREIVCMAAPLCDADGQQVGAIEIFQDLPHAPSAEDPSEISQEQVQILANSLPDMIFTLNRKGVFTQFFWTSARNEGINPDDIVGKTPYDLFPPREAEFLIDAARRVIEAGERVSETWSFPWHGDQRSFMVTMNPLHNSTGKIVAATGVSRDITRDLLCERVLQETSQFSNLYLDLLGTDIYNTHMVAVTIIEMLRERLSGEEAELAQRVKITIEQGINVIKNVELLNTLNKHQIRLEPIDLDCVIRDQIRRYAGIDIRYEAKSHMVWASPLLEHVISNLISNCIKFGGMKVRIEISVIETADIVTLSVADNGIGIPDHLKPNIFDRFNREGKSTPGSRGLGLHIVKTLVTRYGGRVWASDRVPGKPEEGAAIKIILQKC